MRNTSRIPAMLKSCLPYLGSPNCINKNSRSRELEGAASVSLDSTFQSKNIFVRVVHAGGKVDHYPYAVLASKLLEKIPGKWLARPEVFKHPHESLICPEEYLLPGHKYYVVPLSTIDKLKRNHNKMIRARQVDRRSEETLDMEATEGTDDECMGESFCSAKDFYASKDKCSRCFVRKGSNGVSRRSRILPPLPKAKTWNGNVWEPSLSSIQEVSP